MEEEVINLIKYKILNLILDYDKISHYNYYYGLKESVEELHEEVNDLFKDPYSFKVECACDDCKYYMFVKGEDTCRRFHKKIDLYDNVCSEFQWR